MVRLYEVGRDWDKDNGLFLGYYESEEQASKTWLALATREMPIYYTRVQLMDKDGIGKIHDYGSHIKFYLTINDNKK